MYLPCDLVFRRLLRSLYNILFFYYKQGAPTELIYSFSFLLFFICNIPIEVIIQLKQKLYSLGFVVEGLGAVAAVYRFV